MLNQWAQILDGLDESTFVPHMLQVNLLSMPVYEITLLA